MLKFAALTCIVLAACGGTPASPHSAANESAERETSPRPQPASVAPTATASHDARSGVTEVEPAQTEMAENRPAASMPSAARSPRRSLEGGTCSVVGNYDIGPAGRTTGMGILVDESGGYIVHRSSANHLSVRAIDAHGRPQGDALISEVPLIQRIAVVQRASTGGIDVVGVGEICDRSGSGCVVTASFDASGAKRAHRVEVISGLQQMELNFPRQIGDTLYAELLARWRGDLVAFERDVEGVLAHRALVETGSGPSEPGLGWLMNISGEPVGLTHDTWEREGPRGALIRPSGDVPLVGIGLRVTLSVAPMPESTIGIVFRRVILVGNVREPRGRPRFARLGLDGRLRGEVVDATLESLPPELSDTLHMGLEVVGRRLHFVRRDALGRTVGSPIHIGRAPGGTGFVPPIAFSGTHFVVSHLEHVDGEWVVQTTAIRCEPPNANDEAGP